MIDIRNFDQEELKKYIGDHYQEKAFRAKQVYGWVQKGVSTFDEMTNLSIGLRNRLKDDFILDNVVIEEKLSSSDGTTKYLLKLIDGNLVESVLMKYAYGYSICVSTQVGCRMGCSFCASTIDGMERNLNAGEILGQIFAIQNDINDRIGRVVLMGSGEPLDNYDATIKFLVMVNDVDGLNISHRHITLSTCGIVPKIYELAQLKFQITLAISLHAAVDAVRSNLMPINKRYNISELIEACHYYANHTGRRVTFEYALIKGENDSDEEAIKLAALLKGGLFHVNLIPINAVKERGYKPSEDHGIRRFKNILEKHGIETTIRRELGSDINAACGQLRKSKIL